jgi:hypothetical protein
MPVLLRGHAHESWKYVADYLRAEWEPRPTSPSSIRLIHFGRMLEDKSLLKGTLFDPSPHKHQASLGKVQRVAEAHSWTWSLTMDRLPFPNRESKRCPYDGQAARGCRRRRRKDWQGCEQEGRRR